MKRYVPLIACLAGAILVLLLLPKFNGGQPAGLRLTRGDARAIGETAARDIGIPVDKAWEIVSFRGSPLINKELRGAPERRRAAIDDPVIGPRLGNYFIHFFRRGVGKYPEYGYVFISGRNGETIGARSFLRDEEAGAHGGARSARVVPPSIST